MVNVHGLQAFKTFIIYILLITYKYQIPIKFTHLPTITHIRV